MVFHNMVLFVCKRSYFSGFLAFALIVVTLFLNNCVAALSMGGAGRLPSGDTPARLSPIQYEY